MQSADNETTKYTCNIVGPGNLYRLPPRLVGTAESYRPLLNDGISTVPTIRVYPSASNLKEVFVSSTRYSGQILMKLEFSGQIFGKCAQIS